MTMLTARTTLLGLVLQPLLTAAADNRILRIPLVPHHVHRHRRRLESGENLVDLPRPDRYPRWLVDQGLGDEDFPSNEEVNPNLAKKNNPPVAQQVGALFQGYGTHYADLWCGTPPQRQTVIVDTGSGITAFPCEECHSCGVPKYHIDQLYKESQSSTFQRLACGDCYKGNCDSSRQFCSLSQSYAEGSSWYAFEARDSCYVGGLHESFVEEKTDANDWNPYHAPHFAVDTAFGCQTKITGLFIKQLADGIMGMDKAKAAFWMQLLQGNKIDRSAFALCFSRSDSASKQGTEAGAMSLGGADAKLHTTPMVYTYNAGGTTGFYKVHIRAAYLREGVKKGSATGRKVIKIQATESALNTGHVIVDSGTTDTYFHRKFGEHFVRAFEEMTGEKYSTGEKKMTHDEVLSYPTILFQLAGDDIRNLAVREANGGTVTGLVGTLDSSNPLDVLLEVPPTHYFEYDEEDGRYSSRFYVKENRGSVFGANSMMGHDVLFDIDNNVLGWAKSDCNYTDMVKRNYNGKFDSVRVEKEASAAAEEDRFNPEDAHEVAQSGKVNSQFCRTANCQVTFAFGIIGTLLAVGFIVVRRSGSDMEDEVNELQQAELEMQMPPSAMGGGENLRELS